MVTAATYSCFKCFNVKINFEKTLGTNPFEKFPSLVLPRDMIMIVTTPCYPIFTLLSVKWSLTGGQTSSSKSSRGHFQEVVAYKRFQIL